MTTLLADPISEVMAAAQALLTRRTGAAVTLVDPEDLGGTGQTMVIRVRTAENPFALPKTLVVKQVHQGSGHEAFVREVVSYQFANAMAAQLRPGPELIAYDFAQRLLIMTDLGDVSSLTELLAVPDRQSVTHILMAWAQALGRLHAATVGAEDDFRVLLSRADSRNGADLADELSYQLNISDVQSMIKAVPRQLLDNLAIRVPADISSLVMKSVELFGTAGLAAFSPSDVGPDNILMTDEGVRFLDYEWGGFRDATLDIAYALTTYSYCVHVDTVDLDSYVQWDAAMLDAWRSEVVGIWPVLSQDAILHERIIQARLIWLWLSVFWFYPNEFNSVGESYSTYSARQANVLAVADHQVLQRRWNGLAHYAESVGSTAIAKHVQEVAAALNAV
ncbi:MAG: phosphotransferase family protein [Mycobacteriaceae bacterium]